MSLVMVIVTFALVLWMFWPKSFSGVKRPDFVIVDQSEKCVPMYQVPWPKTYEDYEPTTDDYAEFYYWANGELTDRMETENQLDSAYELPTEVLYYCR